MTSYDEFATKIVISLVAINCIVALIKAIHFAKKAGSRNAKANKKEVV